MDPIRQLDALIELAQESGIAVRFGPSHLGVPDEAGGALVRLRDEEILFLDPRASVGDQIAATVAALADREELEQRYLPPHIRELLDGR